MRSSLVSKIFTASLVISLSACTNTIPKEALQLSPESLERRQLQTRVFDTTNETEILAASAGVLQDLGFGLDESETDLGVIVGSKDRDATEAGQIAGAVLMAVLFGVHVPTDDKQKIRASLVTRPVGESGDRVALRVTFQRIIWNTQGQISRVEAVDEPDIYQEFFSNLSKSVFLEAQEM